MADSTPTTAPDIEQLNALAVRLDDRADEITQVTLHDLEQDIRAAARVASELARWRFSLAEIAASLPAGTHARNEVLKLLGKPQSRFVLTKRPNCKGKLKRSGSHC